MRRFITDLFYLSIFILLFNLVISFFIIIPIVYKDYEYNAYELMDGKFKFFIFSDSHGWSLTNRNEENKEYLHNEYIHNFSYGSDSYSDILVKMSWLIENDYKIDSILLSVDDHMLTKKFSNRNRSISYSNLLLHRESYSISAVYYYYYLIAKYVPMIYPSNQKLIVRFFENRFLSQIEDNTEIPTESNSDDSGKLKNEIVNSRLQVFFSDGNKPNAVSVQALRNIIDLASENQIEIVGIKFPVDLEFLDGIDSLGMKNSVVGVAKSLGVRHFVDYSQLFKDSIYFSNIDHVNEIGGRILSEKIVNDLRNRNFLNY